MTFRFFPYKGSKRRLSKRLPADYFPVIEPFAGSASFATEYALGKRAILCDMDPKIAAVWRWLRDDTSEFIELPDRLVAGTLVSEVMKGFSQPAKDFMRLWAGGGRGMDNKVQNRADGGLHPMHGVWEARTRGLLNDQRKQIAQWEILCSSYRDVPNQTATWFIDPPYHGRKYYRYNALDTDKFICFVLERRGLSITTVGDSRIVIPGAELLELERTTGVTRTNKERFTERIYIRKNYA